MSYVRLFRPLSAVVYALLVWAGALLAGSQIIPEMNVLYGMLAILLIAGGGFAANDYIDFKMDIHNKPGKPIPSGRVSRGGATIFAIILFIIGNYLGHQAGVIWFTLIITLIFLIYSLVKKYILIGHLVLGALAAATLKLGGEIQGDIMATAWLAAFLFVAVIGKDIFRSLQETMGESKALTKNLATKFGVLRAKVVGAVFLLAAAVISIIPFFLEQNIIYLFFSILGLIFLLSSVAAPIRYSRMLINIGILLVLLAFILSTSQIQAILV